MGFFNRKKTKSNNTTQSPNKNLNNDYLNEWGTSGSVNLYNFIQRY